MRVSVLLILAALCFASVVVASSAPLDGDVTNAINAWPSDEIMPLLNWPKDLDIPVFESESKHSLMEMQSEQKLESDLDAEAEADSEAAAEAELEAMADNAAEVEAEAEIQAETEAEAEANQEVDTELAAEAEADAEAEGNADAEAETEVDAEAEMEAELATEVDAGAATETEAEAEVEASTEATAEATTEVAVDASVEMMTEAQALAALAAKVAAGWSAQIKGNGCGSGLTAKLVPDWNMLTACNTHDGCYDSCGVGKAYCDNNFYTNMLNLCKTKYKPGQLLFKICNAQAKIYYEAVKNFGKGPFENARKAKKCPMSATAAGVAPKF